MLNQQMPAQARSFRQLLFLHTVTAIPVPLLSLAVAGFSHPSVWVFVHPGAHQSFGSGVFHQFVPRLPAVHLLLFVTTVCGFWHFHQKAFECVCLPSLSLLYPSASSSCLGASFSTPPLSRGMAVGPDPAAPGTCPSGHKDAS